MTSKFSGRYLILDIGKAETKIMDASIAGSTITVFKTVDMKDMTPFVSTDSFMLGNIRGFVESLVNTLKSFNIKTSRVLVCSSILGIRVAWEDKSSKTYKDSKELDKYYQEQIGRATSNLTISDYKLYGCLPSETDLRYRVMTQRGGLLLLKDFIATMHEYGLNVQHIESSTSAMLNLSVLFSHSYDLPTTVLIDMGTSVTICMFTNGVQVTTNTSTFPLTTLVRDLSVELGVPPIKIKKYLYKIGAIRTTATESELYNDNIDAEQYFSIINRAAAATIESLRNSINSQISSRNLGHYQVQLMGGIMDIPGIYQIFETIWKDIPIGHLVIESKFATKTLAIVNKLNSYVDNKYAPCLGVLLGNQFQRNINLVPSEAITINSNNAIVAATQLLLACVIMVSVALVGIAGYNGVQMYRYRNVESYLTEVNTQVTRATVTDNKYKAYLEAIQDIDNVAQPLIEFVTQYTDTSLRIASIDTPQMLVKPTVEPNSSIPETTTDDNFVEPMPDGITPIEGTTDTSGTDTTSGTTDTTTDSTQQKSTKQNIIIRGYATDSSSITEFFNRLQAEGWVPDLSMTGVKQIQLNANEVIYIFEIEIRRFAS